MKALLNLISVVLPFLSFIGDKGVSITGRVNPQISLIGQNVTLSCQAAGCTSTNLQVHLYKWEGSKNQTLYIYNSTKQQSIQESSAGERDRDVSHTEHGTLIHTEYKNSLLSATLLRVKLENSGQYVCALTCDHAYKEAIMEVKVEGVIYVTVGGVAVFPCHLIQAENHSHLKLQWRRISPGKSQTLYSFLYQGTCPVIYYEDTCGNRSSSSNGPSSTIRLRKKYEQRAEVPKSNMFVNRNISLKLRNIQEKDAGKYECLVESNSLRRVVILELSVRESHLQNSENWMLYFWMAAVSFSVLVAAWYFLKNMEKLKTENEQLNEINGQQKEKLSKLDTEVKWRRAHNNAVNITLDEESAHPNILIAGDKNSFTSEEEVLQVSSSLQRFDAIVAVLGSEGFSSGNHYWEVDISSSNEWDLGVARKSIKRKGKLSLSRKEGFWVLGLSGKDYWAKTDPWTRITVQRKPRKIGIHLSFQEKKVTFFNVADMSVMFEFNDCAFSESIYPFFKNTNKRTTMRICSIKEEE